MRLTRKATAGSVLVLALLAAPALADSPSRPPAEVARAGFAALAEDCHADGGALWGRTLCGPVLLVDSRSRTVWGDEADAAGRLHLEDGVYTGKLDAEVLVANTAVDWAGKRWAMVMLPLPDDPLAMRRLLLHESFHRIQDGLGLGMSNPQNAHLESVEGRFLLQLEWRALAAALRAAGAMRQRAVEDTLLLRWRRQEQFPTARDDERALELNEGIAEYTGLRLAAGGGSALAAALAGLERGPQQPTFVRSFAYASGPAYGLLLDAAMPTWRQHLDAQADLGALLAQAYGVKRPAELAAAVSGRLGAYDGAPLLAAEQRRHDERAARAADLRHRLVDGPVLRLPFRRMSISFDPNGVEILEGQGNAYARAEIRDAWGLLRVTGGGVLVDGAWSSAQVAAPAGAVTTGTIPGDGWTLELTAGWRLAAGRRAGDLTIEETPAAPPAKPGGG